MSGRSRRSAFTLVELLVIVAIIAMLIAVLLPSMQRAMYEAKIVSCTSNLKQVGIGVFTYCSDNRGRYPHNKLTGRHAVLNADGEYGRSTGYSWAVYQKEHHDMVDILDGYFGDMPTMRDTFTCSLARKDWEGEAPKSSKLYYGTNSGQQSYALFWNTRGDHWSITRGMYRLGQRWQQGRRFPAYQDQWFNVVASDMVRYGGYGGSRATHYPPGSPKRFKQTTCVVGYEYDEPTNANYLTDDGAVSHHRDMWPSSPHAAGSYGMMVPGVYATSSP